MDNGNFATMETLLQANKWSVLGGISKIDNWQVSQGPVFSFWEFYHKFQPCDALEISSAHIQRNYVFLSFVTINL